MKLNEAKPLVIAAWDDWAAKSGISPNYAEGRDALRFYYELQDTKSPLLRFMSRARDKWEVIYDWLMHERQIGSQGCTIAKSTCFQTPASGSSN
jgi:nuclear transport factor 2 (NTF2) superfamily protein